MIALGPSLGCFLNGHCLLVGHVMSHHHSDHMSQMSQVFRVVLSRGACMSTSKVSLSNSVTRVALELSQTPYGKLREDIR